MTTTIISKGCTEIPSNTPGTSKCNGETVLSKPLAASTHVTEKSCILYAGFDMLIHLYSDMYGYPNHGAYPHETGTAGGGSHSQYKLVVEEVCMLTACSKLIWVLVLTGDSWILLALLLFARGGRGWIID